MKSGGSDAAVSASSAPLIESRFGSRATAAPLLIAEGNGGGGLDFIPAGRENATSIGAIGVRMATCAGGGEIDSGFGAEPNAGGATPAIVFRISAFRFGRAPTTAGTLGGGGASEPPSMSVFAAEPPDADPGRGGRPAGGSLPEADPAELIAVPIGKS